MRRHFEKEAWRISKGLSGLSGDTITFEEEWCALDLQAALKDLGIASAVIKAGKQHHVKLSRPASEIALGAIHPAPVAEPASEANRPKATPAEILSPAEVKGVTATPKAPKKIPNLIPNASSPNGAALMPKEKRRRFVDLAKQDSLSTASELAEEQAQLELFAPVKKKRVRRGAAHRKDSHAS
jgi:hypothetical protein